MVGRAGNERLPEFAGLLQKGPSVVQEALRTIQPLENRTVKLHTKSLLQG